MFGADPELFLCDANGKFISAIGKIGGSKKAPKAIGRGCAIQEDNVAVEFNIEPAETVDQFVASCQFALEHLTMVAAEQNLFLSITASKEFTPDQLQHIRAKLFGCDPDYNAWTGLQNDPPKALNKALRSAGGHIHFGVKLPSLQMARWSDVVLGLKSVIEDPDTERRGLYGKAGAFRGKPYGIEYRTLSNYWLKSPEMMRKIFARSQKVVQLVQAGYTLEDKDGFQIQKAINESDIALADDLMVKYSNSFPIEEVWR